MTKPDARSYLGFLHRDIHNRLREIDKQALEVAIELLDKEIEKERQKRAEEPAIVKTIKELFSKAERGMQQAEEDQDQGSYIFWDGYHTCAEGILREVEEPTEGIKGNLEEIPSNVDLEKEIDACWRNWLSPSNRNEVEEVLPKAEFAMYARHFYELGRKGGKI